MTEILLIRHGETAWNAIKRLQGHLDIPLNTEGEHQAAALGRSLAGTRLDAVFSSDLQRARQTAAAIAGHHGLPVQSDAGLRERCYGVFEGMLYAEISERYPQAFAAWKARDIDARFPAGVHVAETMREFAARTIGAIERLACTGAGEGNGKDRRIAMVAHGGVLECAYRAALRMDFAQERTFDIFNASVNRFSWDGEELKLLQWGDVSHLAKLDAAALDEVAR